MRATRNTFIFSNGERDQTSPLRRNLDRCIENKENEKNVLKREQSWILKTMRTLKIRTR